MGRHPHGHSRDVGDHYRFVSAHYRSFFLTQQGIQLGYIPRLTVRHTSAASHIGQIYVPAANWAFMFSTTALVAGFGSSSRLASAYGVAVTATMLISAVLFYYVARDLWN